MVLSDPVRPVQTAASTSIVGSGEGARLLAGGVLGARLVQAARLAAAVHLAQTAAQRNEDAQILPRWEAAR